MSSPSERAAGKMAKTPANIARAYKAVFSHPDADVVLAHLLDTCSVNESTIDENVIIMAAAEGRRQVWLAINSILSMTPKDIAAVNEAVAAWGDETDG